VTQAVTSATDTLTSATEPVTQTVTSATDTVPGATDPVTHGVASVADTLTTAAGSATDPMAATDPTVGSVAGVVNGLDGTIAAAASSATQAVATAGETVSAASATAQSTTDAVAAAALPPPVEHASAAPLDPITALAPSVVPVVPDGITPVPGVPTLPLYEAVLPTDDGTPLHPGFLGAPADSLTDSPPASFDGALLGAFGDLDPGEFVPLLAGMGATAVTTMVILQRVCSPSASLLFTNVRLLPCYSGSFVEQVTRSSSQVSVSSAARELDRVREIGGRAVDEVSRGFSRVVSERDSSGRGLTDSRLLVQIGIVLGLVYCAFLTLWFWATRIRWNPRDFA
jgi:hypothetical protein